MRKIIWKSLMAVILSAILFASVPMSAAAEQAQGSGSTALFAASVSSGTTVTYTANDFVGKWEGSYRGVYTKLASSSTYVWRDFTVNIDRCTATSTTAGKVYGTISVSVSDSDTTGMGFTGTCDFVGDVNFSTGKIMILETEWTSRSTEDYYFGICTFYGTISSDKSSISGTVGKNSGRTFSLTKVTSSGSTETTRITVYCNQNSSTDADSSYILCPGATVAIKDSYTTDSSGNASVPAADIASYGITVSKAGYVTQTLTAAQVSASPKVYLQPESDGVPVISGVWLDGLNILSESCPMTSLDGETVTLTADVDWGGSSYGSIRLTQGSDSLGFTDYSLTADLSDTFDISEDIYISATDAAGNTVEEKLAIANGATAKALNSVRNADVNFSDTISVTLPDDFTPAIFAGMEIGTSFPNAIPISYSVENGNIYVAIGLDFAEVSYKSDKKGMIQSFGQKFKAMVDDISKTSYNKLKSDWKNYMKSDTKGKWGVSADFIILGYAEGSYDSSGSISWQYSKLVINPSVNLNRSYPFTVGGFPLFFETSFTADILAELAAVFDNEADEFLADGAISGVISIEGGVGAGVPDVVYTSGGATGNLYPDIELYPYLSTYFKLSASLDGYLKAGVACLENRVNFNIIPETVLYETTTTTENNLLNLFAGNISLALFPSVIVEEYVVSEQAGKEIVSGTYDLTEYEMMDLSYLKNSSEFQANGSAEIASISENTAEGTQGLLIQKFKTNVFKTSTPDLISFGDGERLAVWVDGEDTDANEIHLYYSYYDGSVWSEPEILYEDGTMDYSPQLFETDGNVYVTWQNANTVIDLTDDTELDDLLEYFDISVAEFDPTDHTFASVSTITSDGLDLNPCLCGDGDNMYAVWINAGSWFGENAVIMCSEWNGLKWTRPTSLYGESDTIIGLAADYDGEELHVAYTVDEDGDLSTSDDRHVYEDGERVSDSEEMECNPSYYEHDLYWYTDHNVVNQTMDAESGNISSFDYQVVEMDGCRVLLYTTSNGYASEVQASCFDEEENAWGDGFALTDGESYIGAFSAAMVSEDEYMILMNSAEVDEDGYRELLEEAEETGDYNSVELYGESDLCLLSVSHYCDLGIENVAYSEDDFYPGDPMSFDLELKNNGTQSIDSVTVEIRNGSGDVLSSAVEDVLILPGNTVSVSAAFTVSPSVTAQDVEIYVSPDGLEDTDSSDNTTGVFTLGYEDLGVDNITWGYLEDGNICVSADIVNYGCTEQKDIAVSLIRDASDGEVLETQTISSVSAADMQTVSFTVNAESGDVYFVVLEDWEDDLSADNAGFVVILEE